MSESQEQRSSSSDSDNFEKIDVDEARQEDSTHNPHFVVGDEADPDPAADYDGPAHEGRDSFPNAPPPNIRRALTQAQQLALAEKRSKLRFILSVIKMQDYYVTTAKVIFDCLLACLLAAKPPVTNEPSRGHYAIIA